MTRRIMVTLAALVAVIAFASPASAAPLEAQNHKIGSTFQMLVGSGEVLTFHQDNAVEMSTIVSKMDLAQCPGHPMLCRWANKGYLGTMIAYNMNTVYSTTTNGVAHCWNIYLADRNNGESWQNESDRGGWVVDNTNCNTDPKYFSILGDGMTVNCANAPYTTMCNVDSSIKAFA